MLTQFKDLVSKETQFSASVGHSMTLLFHVILKLEAVGTHQMKKDLAMFVGR